MTFNVKVSVYNQLKSCSKGKVACVIKLLPSRSLKNYSKYRECLKGKGFKATYRVIKLLSKAKFRIEKQWLKGVKFYFKNNKKGFKENKTIIKDPSHKETQCLVGYFPTDESRFDYVNKGLKFQHNLSHEVMERAVSGQHAESLAKCQRCLTCKDCKRILINKITHIR